MKEKEDMWVPLKKNIIVKREELEQKDGEKIEDFNFFFSLFILSQIYGNRIVDFRRVKNEKCSTRRGLRVSTKNTGFYRKFR